MDETKNKLLEAKSELDKTMKQKENWRSSDRVSVVFILSLMFFVKSHERNFMEKQRKNISVASVTVN